MSKSQVLPVLEYTCNVWDPHLKKDQLLLESVQLFATRLSSRQWSAKSDILNQYFNLPSLLDCRKSTLSYFLLTSLFLVICIALQVF